jgi:hypothetical protein
MPIVNPNNFETIINANNTCMILNENNVIQMYANCDEVHVHK